MRAFRVAIAGIAAIAATLAIPPSISLAAAADPPTAPYDAFTIDGAGNSWLSPAGQSYTVDDSASTFSLTTWNTGLWFQVTGGPLSVDAPILPPTGGTLGVGSYQTAATADADHAMFGLGVGSHGCDQEDGTLNITEYTVDDSGAVTALAATYSVDCDAEVLPVTGEIRWHSTKDYVAATQTPTNGFAFGNLDLGQTSAPKTVTVTATGSQPVHFQTASLGGKSGASFSLGADTCSNATLSYGDTCTVTITAKPVASGALQTDLVIPDDTAAGNRVIPVTATGVVGAAGTYFPLPPTRILDTRNGNGTPAGMLGVGGIIHLQVEGRGGVPANGVSAVVLNVTVTSGTVASFLTVWPEGSARPGVSNIDFPAGWTGANNTTVAIGSGGKVDIYNLTGRVTVIADVIGYYAKDDTNLSTQGVGGQLIPYEPQRLYDTREDAPTGAISGGSWDWFWLDFGELNGHIKALALNITAVNPATAGFLTAWNGQGDPPTGTSTLNYDPHKTVPNMTIVPTSVCHKTDDLPASCEGQTMFAVYNSAGSTDVLIDLFGAYADTTAKGGLRYRPVTPVRITDSRNGQGLNGALGSGATGTVTVPNTVVNNLTESVALNVTAVAPTVDTYLTLYPAGDTRPLSSNLDPAKGTTVANTANIPLGGVPGLYNRFSVYNHTGTINVLADVQGAFDVYPYTAVDGQLPPTDGVSPNTALKKQNDHLVTGIAHGTR
ncbi:hypothetical protein GCM10023322_42650 [Rugosimonospora acidiphila]|uniref:Choice-of-anchor D domain-containing protein n=1 Tax=Rugosimonospora acidiphila TaxID=556531 RepID=A0ABP9RZJ3_9ACTN